MLVYIFGGERTDYLALQIAAIRQHVPDLSDIRYLQGPLHSSLAVSSASTFTEQLPVDVVDVRISPHEVPVNIKPIRLRNLIRHCMENFDNSRSLFLHGDTVPFDTIDADALLNGHGSAGAWGFSRQWFLAESADGMDDVHKHNVRSFTKPQWEAMFPGIPMQLMQIYDPSFLHFDNYSVDDQETINNKVRAYELLW